VRELLPRDDIHERLLEVFPRSAFDTVLSNQLAAAAVAAMLYIDAVVPDQGDPPPDTNWARPSLCLWMNDDTYMRDDEADRAAWRDAALGSNARRKVSALRESWGVSDEGWYADNSRETLRDETFSEWLTRGALRARSGLPTTSGAPRWALTASFADLFLPALQGEELAEEIDAWRERSLDPGELVRVHAAHERERRAHAVDVTLPDGTRRSLEPGTASLILKGVLEDWAPSRLRDPVVLSVSEPGDKVFMADDARLRALGLTMDPTALLPDAVLVDIGVDPPVFWMVEAVATDGPVTEERRRQLLEWAADQRIPTESCAFLSAFVSRNDNAARRRLKDIAEGTFAWYADEPARELAWYELVDNTAAQERLAEVTPLMAAEDRREGPFGG
jgi:hypothetical protein